MKQSILMPLFAMSVLMYSCNTGTGGETDTKAEKSSSAVPEEVPVATAELTFAKDPRKLGPEKPESQRHIEDNIYKINASENPLYGYWVGPFGKNKINIAIAYSTRDSVFGHSVCAGNFRPVKGTIKESGPGIYKLNMHEPGTDQYDGAFDVTIDIDKKQLSGSWKPYKNTTGAKEFTLRKRTFKYNPSVGDFPHASTRYLEVPDVENLLPEQIEMIRNEIYARHGYSFTNLKVRRVFDNKDWYIPGKSLLNFKDYLPVIVIQSS